LHFFKGIVSFCGWIARGVKLQTQEVAQNATKLQQNAATVENSGPEA